MWCIWSISKRLVVPYLTNIIYPDLAHIISNCDLLTWIRPWHSIQGWTALNNCASSWYLWKTEKKNQVHSKCSKQRNNESTIRREQEKLRNYVCCTIGWKITVCESSITQQKECSVDLANKRFREWPKNGTIKLRWWRDHIIRISNNTNVFELLTFYIIR